jgi:hypothetical protein
MVVLFMKRPLQKMSILSLSIKKPLSSEVISCDGRVTNILLLKTLWGLGFLFFNFVK